MVAQKHYAGLDGTISRLGGRIYVDSDAEILEGTLVLPDGAQGVVVFVDGGQSDGFNACNRYTAGILQEGNIGTLFINLLTPEEETIDRRTAEFRFNVNFLVRRLVGVTDWLLANEVTRELPIGYCGSSIGIAVAIIAALDHEKKISAIVSRGSRPDFAQAILDMVKMPTLFIVGGNDLKSVEWNRHAVEHLDVDTKVEIIPDASSLFDEPEAMEAMGKYTFQWFHRYFNGNKM